MTSIKLEYDKTEKRVEPVAYVDGSGDLIIFDQTGENEAMAIYQHPYKNELPVILTTADWEPEEAQHNFTKATL